VDAGGGGGLGQASSPLRDIRTQDVKYKDTYQILISKLLFRKEIRYVYIIYGGQKNIVPNKKKSWEELIAYFPTTT
jgi:hypothetical protein